MLGREPEGQWKLPPSVALCFAAGHRLCPGAHSAPYTDSSQPTPMLWAGAGGPVAHNSPPATLHRRASHLDSGTLV